MTGTRYNTKSSGAKIDDAPFYDTVILGAGAAGMMCALHASVNNARVLVLDHAAAPGEKIRISGGGRCNFTNLHTKSENFLSQNRHFAKSALSRFTPRDIVAMLDRHHILWHEKTLGQLFCDGSARQVVAMLVLEMASAGVTLHLQTRLAGIVRAENGFALTLEDGRKLNAHNFVVASGGKSIPKMGATGIGYRLAHQFDIPIVEPRPGLVALTFGPDLMAGLKPMSGLSLPVCVRCEGGAFDDALLITHRGLSGPAILQISSYWHEGAPIMIDLLPGHDAMATLRRLRTQNGRRTLPTLLSDLLPKRLADFLATEAALPGPVGNLSDAQFQKLAGLLHMWKIAPTGTEGYRTAEVTLGGVDTAALSSKTMQAHAVPGLYFIGEVVDVTGWLGGYNFQWAWASGWAAGTAIAQAV